MSEIHSQLRRELRTILKEELATGSYPHLTNPNKNRANTPSEDGSIEHYLARLNILPRDVMTGVDTRRNLSVSRSEIVFVVQAPLFIPGDYSHGLNVTHPWAQIRYVVGQDFRDHGDLRDFSGPGIQGKANDLFCALNEAKYDVAVHMLMSVFNESLGMYKEKAKPTVQHS
ncbi:MAG: hypothetical protein O2779_04360 [Nanoarchaeota archaeon]|nr:hypothetical protein [Nanoarchaeota archaeon]